MSIYECALCKQQRPVQFFQNNNNINDETVYRLNTYHLLRLMAQFDKAKENNTDI